MHCLREKQPTDFHVNLDNNDLQMSDTEIIENEVYDQVNVDTDIWETEIVENDIYDKTFVNKCHLNQNKKDQVYNNAAYEQVGDE